MNHPLRNLLGALTTLALGSSLCAQTPANPPPWWGVQDNVTVSLYWGFSGPTPFTPVEVAVPTWYSSAVTQAVPSGPLQILPSLNGRTDVLALVGVGAPRIAALNMTVDNDPHYNWVKIFWFEFDEFEGASGSIVESLKLDLAKYKRSSMSTKKTSLGNGWNRVTVSAQLIPQPDDEGIDFSFTEAALGTAAIDDLYVNSKCVKLDETDQDGDALGTVSGFSVDLAAATGNAECTAATVTESPVPPFLRTYWIGSRAPFTGSAHQVFQLDQNGIVTNATALPDTLSTAPAGATDLAVAEFSGAGGTLTQIVYAMVDRRSTVGGALELRAINLNGALNAARNITIAAYPGSSPAGLAWNKSGNAGQGTFLITDLAGQAYEFGLSGALVGSPHPIPPNTNGAGYDHVFGNYYFFSSTPQATPAGPVQVNGSEWSAYDFQPTGVRFWGNLQLANPGGPRGGIASGLDVYRRQNGEFHAVCVVRLPSQNRSRLYELKGPFRFGASLLGTTGMQGLPFVGSNNFTVTLSGVPNAVFASVYAGFGQQVPPVSLLQFGLAESNLHITLDMNSTLQLPQSPGEFAFTLPTLPNGFGYVPMHFQWVVFDPSAPGGVGLSQPGKTVIY